MMAAADRVAGHAEAMPCCYIVTFVESTAIRSVLGTFRSMRDFAAAMALRYGREKLRRRRRFRQAGLLLSLLFATSMR